MPFIGQSPWADAANYGAGLGRTLTQGIYEQPRQNFELQAQLGQMAQQQKQQALMNFLAQQRLQNQQSVGQSTIDRNEAQAGHYQNPATKPQSSKWTFVKEGNFLLDQNTGEIKPVNLGGGTNGMPVPKPIVPQTQNQEYQNLDKLGALAARFKQSGMDTNLPSIFQAITNSIPQLGGMQRLPMQPGTNAPAMLGATNNPGGPRVLNFNPATGQLE